MIGFWPNEDESARLTEQQQERSNLREFATAMRSAEVAPILAPLVAFPIAFVLVRTTGDSGQFS